MSINDDADSRPDRAMRGLATGGTLVLACLVVACGGPSSAPSQPRFEKRNVVTQEEFDKKIKGMTRDEVRKLFGDPLQIRARKEDSHEIWEYRPGVTSSSVTGRVDYVTYIRFEKEENGKVVDFRSKGWITPDDEKKLNR